MDVEETAQRDRTLWRCPMPALGRDRVIFDENSGMSLSRAYRARVQATSANNVPRRARMTCHIQGTSGYSGRSRGV